MVADLEEWWEVVEKGAVRRGCVSAWCLRGIDRRMGRGRRVLSIVFFERGREGVGVYIAFGWIEM